MRAAWRITGYCLVIVMATAAVLTPPPVASAAPMPNGHEGFANDPSICYVCHRTHTATSENLLYSTAGMCLTCHRNGTGADTDVTSGFYNRPVGSLRHAGPWGEVGAPLLGGGFTAVDTDSDSVPETTAYGAVGTSQHDIGVTQTPFGSASGASMKLDCTSCHTMHSGFNSPVQYRSLRLRVGDATGNLPVAWNGPWRVITADPLNPIVDYTVSKAPGATFMAYTEVRFGTGQSWEILSDPPVTTGAPIEYTRNYGAGLSAWCSGCHVVYTSPVSPAGPADGLGGANQYRHKTEVPLTGGPGSKLNDTIGTPSTNLPLTDQLPLGRSADDTINCLTCHRAHGTTARMDGMAMVVPAANRGTLPGMTTSMLLRMDNRSVCVDCHGYLGKSGF